MRFDTTMFAVGRNTGIEVPPEVVDELGGGKRAAVIVTVNGYEYRSTLATMGGRFLIPFSADRRAETGIGGGDALVVDLVLDTAPRIVELPDDLATALADADVRDAFDALAPSRRKADVASVEGAKTIETRSRRIAAIVTRLG